MKNTNQLVSSKRNEISQSCVLHLFLTFFSRLFFHVISLYSSFPISLHLFASFHFSSRETSLSPPQPHDFQRRRIQRRCLQARAQQRRRWRQKRGARRTKRPRARKYTTIGREPDAALLVLKRFIRERNAYRTRDTRTRT